MTQPFRYYLRVRYQECDPQHHALRANGIADRMEGFGRLLAEF